MIEWDAGRAAAWELLDRPDRMREVLAQTWLIHPTLLSDDLAYTAFRDRSATLEQFAGLELRTFCFAPDYLLAAWRRLSVEGWWREAPEVRMAAFVVCGLGPAR